MNFWIDLLFPYQTFTLSFVCVHNTYTQTLKRTTKHKEIIMGKVCVTPAPHKKRIVREVYHISHEKLWYV